MRDSCPRAVPCPSPRFAASSSSPSCHGGSWSIFQCSFLVGTAFVNHKVDILMALSIEDRKDLVQELKDRVGNTWQRRGQNLWHTHLAFSQGSCCFDPLPDASRCTVPKNVHNTVVTANQMHRQNVWIFGCAKDLPRNVCVRRVNEVVARARAVKVHLALGSSN